MSGLFGGGGGGGGGTPAPTASTVTNTNIPEYARPYVESMLGATQQQLFNVDPNGNISGIKPYQPYSQNVNDYFAGFSPMQQQAMQSTANMQMPGQYADATQGAQAAGIGAMNVANQATPQNFQQDVGGYMNPYMQQVLTPQMDELRRQYGITGAQQSAQAAQAGAFGGSRGALMASENQRNLGAQQSQALGQAYGNAFNQAQQQYNQSTQNRLAGYGLLGQQASNLANIGGQQLQAQQGIIGLQNQMGAQQQTAEQNKINQAIQNYGMAQQYPQQQLAFMNSMLRGLPLQTSTVQQYQAAPSAVSQIAGLGTTGIAGLGLYNAMNKP